MRSAFLACLCDAGLNPGAELRNHAGNCGDAPHTESPGARLKLFKHALSLSFKVSEKGAVSVYGLGRFPVTLYFEQWSKLLSYADELRAFMEASKSKLKLKEQSQR